MLTIVETLQLSTTLTLSLWTWTQTTRRCCLFEHSFPRTFSYNGALPNFPNALQQMWDALTIVPHRANFEGTPRHPKTKRENALSIHLLSFEAQAAATRRRPNRHRTSDLHSTSSCCGNRRAQKKQVYWKRRVFKTTEFGEILEAPHHRCKQQLNERYPKNHRAPKATQYIISTWKSLKRSWDDAEQSRCISLSPRSFSFFVIVHRRALRYVTRTDRREKHQEDMRTIVGCCVLATKRWRRVRALQGNTSG